MSQKVIISAEPTTIKKQIEIDIQQNNSLLLRRINTKQFFFVSKKNYGKWSMIEKEYFSIKGNFEYENHQTILNYEVKSNSTYTIFSIILPIMMLPTIFLSAIGNDNSNLLEGIILYLIMSGITIFWTLSQRRKLKKMGEKAFQELLDSLDLSIIRNQ